MEKILRPAALSTEPTATDAAEQFMHWKATFTNFLAKVTDADTDTKQYEVLINYVSTQNYLPIKSLTSYKSAIDVLQKLFVKVKNENFSRYLLGNRKQNEGESLDQYLLVLDYLLILYKLLQFSLLLA